MILYEIIQDFDHDIFAEKEGPFVSIYQNTHKLSSEIEQDLISFKNHLKTVEGLLLNKYDDDVVEAILQPLRNLKEIKTFWDNNTNAFALFASQKNYVVIRLNNDVIEKAIVADSFHKKPLIRHFQTGGAFDVLTINRESFALYTCTQDVCHKVEFEEGVPIKKEEVLGTLDEEGYLSHASYNGASKEPMYHGHEDSRNVTEVDTERYFRYVDHFINDTYSKATNRPLVLWALPEHQGEFRKLSKNKYLLKEGINQSDKELTEEKVLSKAWEIIKPRYEEEMQQIVDRYQQAYAKGLASDNINEIGKKTIQGNVDTAIIAANRTIPGKLNSVDGTIIGGVIEDPTYDDVLDDLAEHIYHQGGSVYVLDDEDMPTDKGIVAIFRY